MPIAASSSTRAWIAVSLFAAPHAQDDAGDDHQVSKHGRRGEECSTKVLARQNRCDSVEQEPQNSRQTGPVGGHRWCWSSAKVSISPAD